MLGTKLGYYTPFSSHSGVSDQSRAIAAALHRRMRSEPDTISDLTVYVNENGPTFWSDAKLKRLDDQSLIEVHDSAFVPVYNIGNNSSNHFYINRLALHRPGVVVVHDLIMHHFWADYLMHVMGQPSVYVDLVTHFYGKEGADIVKASGLWGDRVPTLFAPWDTDYVKDLYLLEPFLRSAKCVVVHSEYAASIAREMTDAPIEKARLVWDNKSVVSDEDLATWQSATNTACKFVCIGHIHKSKKLVETAEAFLATETLSDCTLIIAGGGGTLDYIDRLERLVTSSRGKIRLERNVTEERLIEIKNEADAFVNIRSPNTEGASASLVEQLVSGKPVILLDSGSFSEVPSDSCIKLPDFKRDTIGQALHTIAKNPQLRVELGQKGRNYAKEYGSNEYAEFLEGIVKDMGGAHGNVAPYSILAIPNARLVAGVFGDFVDRSLPEDAALVHLEMLCGSSIGSAPFDERVRAYLEAMNHDELRVLRAKLRIFANYIRHVDYMMPDLKLAYVDEHFLFLVLIASDEVSLALMKRLLRKDDLEDFTGKSLSSKLRHLLSLVSENGDRQLSRRFEYLAEQPVFAQLTNLETAKPDKRYSFDVTDVKRNIFNFVGFGDFDTEGVWSTREESSLSFSVPRDCDEITIEVKVMPSVSNSDKEERDIVLSCGRVKVELEDKKGTQLVRLENVEVPTNRLIELRLEVSELFRPSDFTKSADERELGVWLLGLEFEKVISEKIDEAA